MAAPRSASTFSEALRARDDDQLVALLRARPDLANPSPSTLRSLAARATGTASTDRALASCDRLQLQVLESVTALGAVGRVPDVAALVAALEPADGGDASVLGAAIRRAVDRLEESALVWASSDGLRPAPGVAPLLGPYPAGLGPAVRPGAGPAAGPTTGTVAETAPSDDDVRALAAAAPPAARAILDALLWGPPVGVAPAEPRAVAAVDRLQADGLVLTPEGHVVLPAEVALALRGGRTHRGVTPGPSIPADDRFPGAAAGAGSDGRRSVQAGAVDDEAARAALEAVRLVTDLVHLWDDEPPTVLRTGGLAVRDLRRLTLHLDVDDQTAAAIAELALAAELVTDDGNLPAAFTPTTAVDPWLVQDDATRWARLAHAWFTSPRTPWLAGTRDESGTARSALSPDHTAPWSVRLRRTVLEALASSGPDAGTDTGTAGSAEYAAATREALSPAQVRAVLAWHAPRNVPPSAAVDGVLAGARLLGVVALDALSGPGASLLDPAPDDTAPASARRGAAPTEPRTAEGRTAQVLDAAFPATVDELLVQGDLTGIVPGRPSRELAELLEAVADVESRGGALTVRFTPASIERGLSGGLAAEDVLARVDRHARGPLPQALDYVVRDVARQHGRVRVGAALSYVRVDDPSTVAALLADPALRALGLVGLAPTVVAANVPASRLHDALAAAGVTAVLEGPDGRAVVSTTERRRAPAPSSRRGRGRLAAPVVDDSARARRVVTELRARDDLARASEGSSAPDDAEARTGTVGGAGAAGDGSPRSGRTPSSTGTSAPGDLLDILREAVDERRLVDLSTVDSRGTPVTRTVRPLRVDGGRLRAVDPARDAELTVAVHRIASVVLHDG